jgi:UDP-N-acetylglucosamine acyltransferase
VSNIHERAIVQDGAKIGENVTVDANVFIGKTVVIGDNTTVGYGAYLTGNTVIGTDNIIGQYAIIGTHPQSLSYKGEDTKIIIGNNNTLREKVEIHKGSTAEGYGTTIIGNDNFIMSNVHIGHDCHIKNSCIIGSGSGFGGHTIVDNETNIGGYCSFHQFTKIGRNTMIGGGSAVAQDIPPFCMVEGNRAVVRGLNIIGLRRKLGRDILNSLKPVYRKLFLSDAQPKEIAKDILKENDINEYTKELCQFVLDSKRGIPLKTKNQTKDKK